MLHYNYTKSEGSFLVINSLFTILSTITLASSLFIGEPSAGTTKPIKPVTVVGVEKIKEGNPIENILKLEKQAKEQSVKKVNWPHVIHKDPAPKPSQALQPAYKPKPMTIPHPVAKQAPSPTRTVTVVSTAYTAHCQEGCTGRTATGINLDANPNIKLIAVDPNIIPLGKKVYVEGYGEAITADTGGAIRGNRIDVYMRSEQDAFNWGVRTIKVTILN